MALAIGHMLINAREHFFRRADPAVSSLVLWHFIEELEHKHAAFDVYQHMVGRYWMRIYGLFFAIWHTLSRTQRAYAILLKADGLWGKLRTRLAIKRELWCILKATSPWILESLSPRHDPSRFDDPEWAKDWVRMWDADEPGLIRLDTMAIDRLPSEMAMARVRPAASPNPWRIR